VAANLPASSLLPTIRQRCTSPDAWNKVPRPDAYHTPSPGAFQTCEHTAPDHATLKLSERPGSLKEHPAARRHGVDGLLVRGRALGET